MYMCVRQGNGSRIINRPGMGAELSSCRPHSWKGVRVARHCNNKVINNPVSREPPVGGEEAYWWRMTQSQLKEPTSHLYILHVFVPYLSVLLYLINPTLNLCLSVISLKAPMLF